MIALERLPHESLVRYLRTVLELPIGTDTGPARFRTGCAAIAPPQA